MVVEITIRCEIDGSYEGRLERLKAHLLGWLMAAGEGWPGYGAIERIGLAVREVRDGR